MNPSPRIRFAKSGRQERPLGLGVIGLGTVGSGTLQVLAEHRREIERRVGCALQLKVICSRGVRKKDLSWMRLPVKITPDWKQVIEDPEVNIVVELVGVLPTARDIAFATLDAGKHLVTANKQLVAEYGVELVERSRKHHVGLGIEACVAGGMPVLHAVREGLAGENFTAVYGILNGTTNYILTEMERRGCSFGEVLAEAQEKGYAEPDPTFDIEGYDASYKIAILAMMCFGQAVKVRDIPVQGITRIDQVDFAYAHRLNHTLRLIAGVRRRSSNRLEVFVRPMMIPISSRLASVKGATNGVLLVGNKGGNTSITGRGAGGKPRAWPCSPTLSRLRARLPRAVRARPPSGMKAGALLESRHPMRMSWLLICAWWCMTGRESSGACAPSWAAIASTSTPFCRNPNARSSTCPLS